MTREELLKKSKPILFNTEMVRAILDGRKTVTRRVIKPQPISNLCYTFAGGNCRTWGYPSPSAHKIWGDEYKLPEEITKEELKKRWNPPYHTDDVLYVRETWSDHYVPDEEGKPKLEYCYKADGIDIKAECLPGEDNRWYPSIHMPKEAARIFLKVTDVRVERLQEITDEQAEKEGLNDYTSTALGFCYLWDSTIKKSDLDTYGWDANPFVWCISFERIIPD